MTNPANDGDSFHVLQRGREYIFRLYFADAPETSEQVPERVAEQAEHWGTNARRIMESGEAAAQFTAQFLRRPFTVYTRKQDARGESRLPRYYALVEVDGKFLHAALIEAGLARAYGMWTDLPDGTPGHDHVKDMDRLEAAARRAGRGAWKWTAHSITRVREAAAHVEPQRLRLGAPVGFYTDEATPRLLGVLPAGLGLEVVEARSGLMVHVRWQPADGAERNGLCRRSELAAAGLKL